MSGKIPIEEERATDTIGVSQLLKNSSLQTAPYKQLLVLAF